MVTLSNRHMIQIDSVHLGASSLREWITLLLCIWDLTERLKRRGNINAILLKLVSGIYSHKPDKLFECYEGKDKALKRSWLHLNNTCERVQVLLPPSLGR